MSSDALPFEILRQQAFHLPIELRNELAHDLLDSVEPESANAEVAVDDELLAEIERRSHEAHSGEVTLVDWRESIERLRAKLKSIEK